MRSAVVAALIVCTSCAGSNGPRYMFESQPHAVVSGEARAVSGGPMFFTSNGELYILAGTRIDQRTGLSVYVSSNGGDTFDERIPVAPPAADVMMMGEMSPTMLQDPTSLSMDVLYEGADDELYFARASLFAHRFPPAVQLVRKRTPSPNGFATMALSPAGILYVAWLDGRASDHNPPNTYSLYVARSMDHGRSFEEAVKVDGGTCPCCRPAFAFGAGGVVYVAWRKVFPGQYRDIVVAMSRDGTHFSGPARVSRDGWSLLGCPDSGPTLKVVGKLLYVAWYTQGTADTPQLRFAYSNDARTFSPVQSFGAGVSDVNHPKFVGGTAVPLLVFQGRPSGSNPWAPLTSYIARVEGGTASAVEMVPAADGSISDPVAEARDANTIFVAATAENGRGSQLVLERGREP